MKNYLRLVCSNCLRTIDRPINNTHYTPDKCTITLGCEGRLSPVKEVANPSFSVTPRPGTRDWHARVVDPVVTPEVIRPARRPTVIQSDVIGINDGLISGETGTKKQIILAAKRRFTGQAIPARISVVFDVAQQRPRDYRHHIIRKDTTFSEIAASDPGLNPRPLRYNVTGLTPDTVEVRVNGVLRTRSATDPEGYQLYTGDTSGVPPNSIRFNAPVMVTGRTQVDITVLKSAGAPKIETAQFVRQTEIDESRVTTGAFENIESVQRFNVTTNEWEVYDLYRMDLDSSGLPLNTLMTPSLVQPEATVDFASAFFLLARQPYTQVDRYTNIVVPFRNFSMPDDRYIKYYEDTQLKQTTMRVSVQSIETVYPPLRFDRFETEVPLKTAVHGFTEQVTIDGNVIVGPDS